MKKFTREEERAQRAVMLCDSAISRAARALDSVTARCEQQRQELARYEEARAGIEEPIERLVAKAQRALQVAREHLEGAS